MLKTFLRSALLVAVVAIEAHGAVHYRPDGGSAVCIDGTTRYNRALYGAHSGFRMECSDMPEFGLYLPGMGGHLDIELPAGECKAVYTPGRMDYNRGGVTLEAQVMRTSPDVALWRITNTTGGRVEIPVRFGGVSGKKFSRDGDLGVDAPDCFDLKPAYCEGNVMSVDGNVVKVEFGAKERRTIQLDIPSDSHKVTSSNVYEGVISLAPGQSKIIAYFPGEIPAESLDVLMNKAENGRKELASFMVTDTPDEWFNPVGAALAMATDGIWSGQAWLHGSIGWRTPHLGWRGAYAGDAMGMYDRAMTHLVTYADNQITDIPATLSHPCQDPKQNMARAEKKWGTPMYSNGYICRRPGKKNEMSHYDMNMVYADAMLRHFLHTGDTASMRRLYPVLQRHLAWEKLNFDPDGDHLYDAYCCIWASDALYYNGGAVTHSSAYNYFANLMASRVAEALGEDAAPYRAEAEAIAEAIDSVLWMPEKGCWAEFKDLGGHQRVHPYPAVWTIYHAVDSRVGDPFKRYAATCYIDREIPRLPVPEADSLYIISTTNWKPYSWSINNVAIAEEMHTVLAYWQAGRNDDAYKLMKGVMMDNMYCGASPLNFGQISRSDAARGECYRDFADPVGVWGRAVTEGLYGIRPDMLGADKSVTIRPGFPSYWDHASVSLADISYSFKRCGNTDVYEVESRYKGNPMIVLDVPAHGLSGVTVDGRPAQWHSSVDAIGAPYITVTLPQTEGKKIVRVYRDATRSKQATGSVRTEGPVTFREFSSGLLSWWEPTDNGKVSDSNSIIAKASSSTGDFTGIEPDKCVPVDLKGIYNASVTDIFNNQYTSPRPAVTTLQIPVQGIGEWCHPQLTAKIDDSGLRNLARKDGTVRLLDIPFALPTEGNNVAYTTLWDNYPTSVMLPLSGNASHVYMLMAGSTNHMQWGMENARITVRYADGTANEIPLVNPVNWAPIEQDFYTDKYAFAQPEGTALPYRVHLLNGQVSLKLGDNLGLKGAADRYIDGGAAVLLDVPLDASRKLSSLSLETISHDVVAGIMGVTLQK